MLLDSLKPSGTVNGMVIALMYRKAAAQPQAALVFRFSSDTNVALSPVSGQILVSTSLPSSSAKEADYPAVAVCTVKAMVATVSGYAPSHGVD